MANLFLSSTEKTKLNHTLSSLEEIRGDHVYTSVCSEAHSGCDKWDCWGSCYCANSYE